MNDVTPVLKLVMFLAVLQIVILAVNSMGVFPYTLYQDVDVAELQERGPLEVVGYLFSPDFDLMPGVVQELFGSEENAEFTFGFLMSVLVFGGAAISIATKSYGLMSLVLVIGCVVPMVTRSISLFSRLFNFWDIQSVMYLGLIFFVGILIVMIFYIVDKR